MAVRLLAYEVADLCLGKPPLRSLSSSATVADALTALKSSPDDNFLSVWSCDHHVPPKRNDLIECVCVGKVCMVDIICYLCRDENLASPGLALRAPVSVLLSKAKGLVRHVEPSYSLLEAIDLIFQGAQNLVVPIKNSSKRKQLPKPSSIISSTTTTHNGQEFCWLTQEDIIRFLLSTIGLFSPIPTLSIEALSIISDDFPVVDYHSPASSAIGAISRALENQTSVAVIDGGGTLIGEISPSTLTCCDETAAAAILTLSAGDLIAYIDCGGPPEDIARAVEERMREKNLDGMLEELMAAGNSSSSSSEEDEELASPTTTLPSRVGWWCGGRSSGGGGSYSARMVRRAEAIVCRPWSSLVAVMIQAITHRVSYVWVVEDDGAVLGMVTFADVLDVLRDHLESSI